MESVLYQAMVGDSEGTEEELASQAGTDAAEYTMNVDSQALGMTSASDQVAQAGGQEITWDDKAQQNYATWTVDNVTYEIWRRM